MAHMDLLGAPLAAPRPAQALSGVRDQCPLFPFAPGSRPGLHPGQKNMLREFTDDDGITWRVWDVNPSLHERLAPHTRKVEIRVPEGWLCFESPRERRRLTPIPQDWETIDAVTLKRMCAEAEPARQNRE